MEDILPAFFAGAVSTVACNSLDVIRVNYQLNKKVVFTSDIFYRGLGYGLLTIPTFWSIYFPIYKTSNEILPKPIAAYISSCIGSLITSPLWYLRQMAHTKKYHRWNTPISVYYRGVFTTFLVNLSFTIQMPLYEYLKNKIENNTFNIFLITAISKTIATSVFYPFDTVRAKVRNGESLNGMTLRGYYRGISVYLLRSIPYHTSVFCTYEFMKNRM